MRRIAIGGIVGITAFLGIALAAEAQVIVQPSGPTMVHAGDASANYTATVTCNYNFYFLLRVYRNGTLKHQSNTFVPNSGPTYNFVKNVSFSGWGLQTGDTLIFRGRATIDGTNTYDQKDWTVTVSAGSFLFPRPEFREWAWA